jgi:hypothetical protein
MKLTYKNNWAYIEFYCDGKQIKSLKNVYIDGIKYKVTSTTGSGSYSEQGHTERVTYPDFTVTTKLFGKKKTLSLYEILNDKVKVEVLSIDVKYK